MLYVTGPMDLKGTNTMNWEYQDLRDNATFLYLPVIRRVRRASGASRSDPFLGGEGWVDMLEGWSGKNASFTWKLVGERTLLTAFNYLDKEIAEEGPDGSLIQRAYSKYGYQTPGWKGAPWAYTNVTWVPRQVWIVEGMPKDPYYLCGKHIFYVDKEFYLVAELHVYDKAGEFQYWNPISHVYAEGPSGNYVVGVPTGIPLINTKAQHATPNTIYNNRVYRPLSNLGPDFFTLPNFLQLSK